MEKLIITASSKEDKYKEIIPQLEHLVDPANHYISDLANIAAVLKETFDFYWVGFYLVNEGSLILGPFQGPLACTKIAFGKGVCGSSWKEEKTLIVPDVDQFPGHIACSSLSRSEIVLPLRNSKNEIVGVLDVDSKALSDFDEIDGEHLEKILNLNGAWKNINL